MAKVEWSQTAIDSLDRIVSYIEEQNGASNIAQRIGRDLIKAGESLDTLPGRYPISANGMRLHTGFAPFVLLYDYDKANDAVLIGDVVYGAVN